MANTATGGKGFTQTADGTYPAGDGSATPAYDLNAVDNGFVDAGEAIVSESGANASPTSNQQAQTIATPGSTISQQVITPLNHLGAKINPGNPLLGLIIIAIAVYAVVKLSK